MTAAADGERHAGGAEADPGIESLAEPAALAQRVHRVDRLAIEQEKVGRAFRDFQVRDAFEKSVEQLRQIGSRPALAHAVLPQAEDDLAAGAPSGEKLGNDLGGMLEIRVHQDDRVAASVPETGGDRRLLAEIPAQRHRADVRVDFREPPKLRQRAVLRSVVDE